MSQPVQKDPLRASEQRYRELFENSSDAIFLMDVTSEGRFRFGEINPAEEKLIGLTNDQVAGKYLEDIVPDKRMAETAIANIRRCFEAGHTLNFEETLDFSGPRQINTTLIPIRDNSGIIYRIAGIRRDVTEQKQKEELFALLDFALNHVQEAVFLIDENARLHYVNDEACRILGYTREDTLSLGVGDLDMDWPAKRWPEHWETLKKSGTLVFEGRHKARDKRVFPVEISANYFEYGGRGYNLALARDITERKLSEQHLRLLDFALNYVHEPAYLIDRSDMRFLYVNDEACRALGYSRGELLTMTVFDIDPDYTPEMAAKVKLQADLAGSVTMERQHRAKDGHVFPVEIYTSVFEYDGKLISVALSRDISERKRAQAELQHLNETLEQRVREELAKNREKDHLLIQQSRLAAMGEMVHNIAHQWRQPINALSILLSNLQDSYDYDELTKEALHETVSKGKQIVQSMSSIIDDFRDFFSPSKGKGKFSVGRYVREVKDILGAALVNQNIQLINDIDEAVCADGYANEFAQVLLNVVNNANEAIVAAHREGGCIQVHAAEAGSMIEVRVSDNGGGIPNDVLPKIFDPYFTTKDKGSGIGLYMSKMIIEGSMGGTISAKNVEGGAEILIRIPAAKC